VNTDNHRVDKTPFESIAILSGAVAMFLFISLSCNREKREMVDIVFNREQTFTMKATDVSTLVSDSGITRYRMETRVWLFFEEASEPYQFFPEKIHVEKFDTLFQVDASVDADTAYFYTGKKLWKLIGNVHMKNLKGEHFETSLLYWDQQKKKIYSDRFIRITKGDFVNTGTGFESNEMLTKYTIFHPGLELPYRDAVPDTTVVETPDTTETVLSEH
jgi:LPS export ABC transporter protein LptC